ncbi:hypothetical protein [Bacteroides caecigallinarum]|uniref:hypothetical protein n=1 Tax=Bacteroides caecigallinarum TaxID=1411144 RepID=UPI00195B22D1|nr:hypothetical protein [Bacteroides caecigallinarum]MBM6882664.1 hypothetical protein [Bacteroides caecigallinarum]
MAENCITENSVVGSRKTASYNAPFKVLQGIGFRNIRKECTVERFKPYVEKASTARRVSVDFNAEYQAIYTKRLHFLCSLLKV